MKSVKAEKAGDSSAAALKTEPQRDESTSTVKQDTPATTHAFQSAGIEAERRHRRKLRRQRKSDRQLQRERQLARDMEIFAQELAQQTDGQDKPLHRRERKARKEEVQRLRRVIGLPRESTVDGAESGAQPPSSIVPENNTAPKTGPRRSTVKRPKRRKSESAKYRFYRLFLLESLNELGIRATFNHDQIRTEADRQLPANFPPTIRYLASAKWEYVVWFT